MRELKTAAICNGSGFYDVLPVVRREKCLPRLITYAGGPIDLEF